MSELKLKSVTSGPRIDLEERVIRNVHLCEAGELLGWGLHIEESFIDDLVSFSTSKLPKVPSNFNHTSQLGSGAGYILNVRKEGKRAVGDFHVYEAADQSPQFPNMGEYIFQMAKEDKQAIMFSIAFNHSYYYQLDASGNEIKVWYWDEENGWRSPIKEFGKIFVKFKELHRADLVSKGAATRKLFSSTPTLKNELIDLMQNEDFVPMLESNFQEFTALNEFYSQKNKRSITEQVKSLFRSGESGKITELKNKIAEMEANANNQENQEMESLKKQVTDLQAQLDEKTTELQTANDKITELEKKPATETTVVEDAGGSGELNKGDKDDPIMALSINQHAMKMFESFGSRQKNDHSEEDQF